MGVKPSVSGKPQAAVPKMAAPPAAPQTDAPKQPSPSLKSLKERAPRIGGAKRRINESTVVTVVIILVFLLIGGVSYMYLGQNSGAGGGAADAAGVNGRDTLNGQNGNGTNSLIGSAQESRVGRENMGLTGDTSTTQSGNVNGANVYEANGGIGGPAGANKHINIGNGVGAGNEKAPQGFVTGENLQGNGSSGINRNYSLGMRMGGTGLSGNGNANGNGGKGANPNASRPGFNSW